MQLGPPPPQVDAAVVDAHAAFLSDLHRRGRLLMAGRFADEDDARVRRLDGGLFVISAPAWAEAAAVAQGDPLVQAGTDWKIGSWVRRF